MITEKLLLQVALTKFLFPDTVIPEDLEKEIKTDFEKATARFNRTPEQKAKDEKNNRDNIALFASL